MIIARQEMKKKRKSKERGLNSDRQRDRTSGVYIFTNSQGDSEKRRSWKKTCLRKGKKKT